MCVGLFHPFLSAPGTMFHRRFHSPPPLPQPAPGAGALPLKPGADLIIHPLMATINYTQLAPLPLPSPAANHGLNAPSQPCPLTPAGPGTAGSTESPELQGQLSEVRTPGGQKRRRAQTWAAGRGGGGLQRGYRLPEKVRAHCTLGRCQNSRVL